MHMLHSEESMSDLTVLRPSLLGLWASLTQKKHRWYLTQSPAHILNTCNSSEVLLGIHLNKVGVIKHYDELQRVIFFTKHYDISWHSKCCNTTCDIYDKLTAHDPCYYILRWPTIPKSCFSALLLCFSPKMLCHLAVFCCSLPPPTHTHNLYVSLQMCYVIRHFCCASLKKMLCHLTGCVVLPPTIITISPKVCTIVPSDITNLSRDIIIVREEQYKPPGGMT